MVSLGQWSQPIKVNEKNDWYVELLRGTRAKLGYELSVFSLLCRVKEDGNM